MRRLLLLLCIALAIAPTGAQACRCAERTLAEYFADAESVVIGVLEQVATDSEHPQLTFTLVDDAYKGSAAAGERLTYTTGRSSADCGITGKTGTVYVLFAISRDAGLAYIDICSGTRPLRIPGQPQPPGFNDVPVRFVVQQLTALAGLEVLREVAETESQPGQHNASTLIGLLDIKTLAHGGAVNIYAQPNRAAEILARVEQLEQLQSAEANYEFAAAQVYARHEFGYRVRLTDGRYGWLAKEHAGTWFGYEELPIRRLSYLTSAWQGFLWPEPGAGLPTRTRVPQAPAEIPVNVVKSTRVGGSLWFYVERLSSDPCDGGVTRPVDSGWTPAYGADGAPTVWFFSRGC